VFYWYFNLANKADLIGSRQALIRFNTIFLLPSTSAASQDCVSTCSVRTSRIRFPTRSSSRASPTRRRGSGCCSDCAFSTRWSRSGASSDRLAGTFRTSSTRPTCASPSANSPSSSTSTKRYSDRQIIRLLLFLLLLLYIFPSNLIN